MRYEGTVKLWKGDPFGYGFIAPDDGSPHVFVHVSAVQAAGMRELEKGSRISFATGADERSGRTRVVDLKLCETTKLNDNQV